MKEYNFYVSLKAEKEIKAQLEERETPNSLLRVGVKGGGCSGYSYVIKYEDSDIRESDLTFKIGEIKVVIDNKSIAYLNGTTLDWEKSLAYTGFKFINPNEVSNCGCGHSFSV